MGEGLTVLASSRNTVRTMATRDIYETTFDETSRPTRGRISVPSATAESPLIQSKPSARCGLVVDEQRIDHGPEWRGFDEDERERTGAPLTRSGTIGVVDGDRARDRYERE